MLAEDFEKELRALMKGPCEGINLSWNNAFGLNNVQPSDDTMNYGSNDPLSEGWVSEAEVEKAKATHSAWSLQWYPGYPAGFHILQASSLAALVEGLKLKVE